MTWSASGLPPGLAINAASGISGTPTTAGSFTVTVTVTDRYGQNSLTLTLTITPAPAPVMMTVTPKISGAHQSHSTWRDGSARAILTRTSHKHPVGTIFSFTLNDSAKVSLAFTQKLSGRRVNRRCVAQTHTNRHKPTRTRTVTAGTLSFIGHQGLNKVSFSARISASKKLPTGRYTLVILASAFGKTSAPARLTFTIVKN